LFVCSIYLFGLFASVFLCLFVCLFDCLHFCLCRLRWKVSVQLIGCRFWLMCFVALESLCTESRLRRTLTASPSPSRK
jgi:hypothetical protein